MADAMGALRERVIVQTPDPQVIPVSTVTRSGSVATATAAKPHGFATNDYVTVADAVPAGYAGRVKVTVIDGLTFTYPVDPALATPAAGAMTAVYVSDAQSGRRVVWTEVLRLWAEMMPLRASERLQLEAVQSDVTYRFRVRRRTGLSPTMRLLWTPRWPRSSPQETLEITGVIPEDLTYMTLECAKSPAV